MGYMGLNHWIESDSAADFVANIIEDIEMKCRKELKTTSTPYNTSGDVNIALFAESFLMNNPLYKGNRLYDVLLKTKKSIEKKLKKAK